MNDFVCSDALVMPSSTGTPCNGFLPSPDELLVDLAELRAVDLVAREDVGIAAVGDLHLLQHLPDDHLDVLVVDRHALQPVDLLDLVDEVGREFLHALDRQDVVRRGVAVDDVVAELDHVAVLQVDVLALRDQVLDRLRSVVRRQREPALVLVVAPEGDRAGLLGDDRRVLRPPRLEQLRHPRQAAGDVAGCLADLAWGLGQQDVAGR